MIEPLLVICAIIGVTFSFLIFMTSENKEEDDAIEELLEEWDFQDYLEEIVEEELMLEEEEDTQELLDLLYLNEDEGVMRGLTNIRLD